MKQLAAIIAITIAVLIPALSQKNANPFLGRWDLTVNAQAGAYPGWLGVAEKDGSVEIWFQPRTGNVFQVKDFKLDGSHLVLTLGRDFSLDLDAAGGKLTGTHKRDNVQSPVVGVRAPALIRKDPAAWATPEPLFNGKDLSGWEPMDPPNNHWVVRGGELVNDAQGSNLKTTRSFDDFKLHIEYNCPDHGNSGIYLRGRYEVQVEYEPAGTNPPERSMGSIYGFLAPKEMPKKPGQWETYDITLTGRILTIVRDGVTTIDHKEIPGITGGALNSNEGEPGPFYIQGDHTGGLKFRNITISVPKR
jgi:hypothetical protein